MIGRREFITLLGAAAMCPVGAQAQQPAMPVIGMLHSGSPDPYAGRLAAFRQGLGATGLVEGRDFAIEQPSLFRSLKAPHPGSRR